MFISSPINRQTALFTCDKSIFFCREDEFARAEADTKGEWHVFVAKRTLLFEMWTRAFVTNAAPTGCCDFESHTYAHVLSLFFLCFSYFSTSTWCVVLLTDEMTTAIVSNRIQWVNVYRCVAMPWIIAEAHGKSNVCDVRKCESALWVHCPNWYYFTLPHTTEQRLLYTYLNAE